MPWSENQHTLVVETVQWLSSSTPSSMRKAPEATHSPQRKTALRTTHSATTSTITRNLETLELLRLHHSQCPASTTRLPRQQNVSSPNTQPC